MEKSTSFLDNLQRKTEAELHQMLIIASKDARNLTQEGGYIAEIYNLNAIYGNAHAPDIYDTTPLLYAAHFGNLAAVNILAESIEAPYFLEALEIAAKEGHEEVFKYLMTREGFQFRDIYKVPRPSDGGIFYEAVKKGNIAIISAIFNKSAEEGIAINRVEFQKHFRHFFKKAVFFNRLALAEFMLEKIVEMGILDEEKQLLLDESLILAIKNGHVGISSLSTN